MTDNDETLNARDYKEREHSRLTAFGGRMRRSGITVRVTARENGKLNGRPHHHVVLDIDMESLLRMAAHWRGWKRHAREWGPDARAEAPLRAFRRWVLAGSEGRRQGRTYNELMLSRYLAERWGLGYVDVQEVGGAAGVGYVLTYVNKSGASNQYGRVRVSYSRAASAPWANKAKLIVYAHGGKCCWYPARRADWIEREVAHLERKEKRLNYERRTERSAAIPQLLRAMAGYQRYQATTSAQNLRFRASTIHADRANRLTTYADTVEELGDEREAIIAADRIC